MEEKSNGSSGGGGGSALEARIAAQIAVAKQHHQAASSAHSSSSMLNGTDVASSSAAASSSVSSSRLPSSSGATNLREASMHAAQLGSAGGMRASVELNPLDWAELQFSAMGGGSGGGATGASKRHEASMAGATSSAAHQTPIHNLAAAQRARHAQMFNVVEKLREGQQHIFLQQFNQSVTDAARLARCESSISAVQRWHHCAV
jgi:hypothetical protein